MEYRQEYEMEKGREHRRESYRIPEKPSTEQGTADGHTSCLGQKEPGAETLPPAAGAGEGAGEEEERVARVKEGGGETRGKAGYQDG